MFSEFYGLDFEPFRLTPAAVNNYRHRSFKRALSYLKIALRRGEGILVITGEPGTGKTSLIEELSFRLANSAFELCRLTGGPYDAEGILKLVNHGFSDDQGADAHHPDSVADALIHLERRLIRLNRNEQYPLVLVDEAQLLTYEALELLRQLSNMQMKQDPLIQIILFGHNELQHTLSLPELSQFRQRIVASCVLDTFKGVDATKGYIQHQWSVAGGAGELIPDSLAEVIFTASEGNPRLVNHIMNRLMLYGMTEGTQTINYEALAVIITELRQENILASVPLANCKSIERQGRSDDDRQNH